MDDDQQGFFTLAVPLEIVSAILEDAGAALTQIGNTSKT